MIAWIVCSCLLAPAEDPQSVEAGAAKQSAISQPADAVIVGRWVRDLNGNELALRERAEQQLIDAGPGVLAFLPAISDRTPPEVAKRLARVRQALEQARAELAAAGSLVTLTDARPLAEILQELGRQSGNVISDTREAVAVAAPITVRFDKTPFWRALDELLDQQHLDVDPFSGEPGIAVVGRSGRRPRARSASYSGPFRIEAARFESLLDLREPSNHSLKLFIDVQWEPRLKPILVSQPFDQVKALAGEQEIKVDAQGDNAAPIGTGVAAIELEIPLAPPPRSVPQLTSVKGRLKVLLPGEVEAFRFAGLPIVKEGTAKKTEVRKAALTVTAEGWRRNRDLWELRIRVRFDDPAAALDSYLSAWVLGNEVRLEQAGHEPIAPGGLEQTLQTANEIGVKYLFELPDGPSGWTFVYRSPTAVFNVPVDYEFHDLDLP